MPLLVTDISFRRAPPHLAATGLVGFVTLAIDETVVLRDVALRRTRAGHYGLSFAVRPPRALPLRGANARGGAVGLSGAHHGTSNSDRRKDPRSRYALARPFSAECHVEIERQVVTQLLERGEIP
jgi:hypothetical protein